MYIRFAKLKKLFVEKMKTSLLMAIFLIVSSFSYAQDGWVDDGKTKTLKAHESSIILVRPSKDGTHIFTAASDKSIKKWNIETGELVEERNIDYGKLKDIEISVDETYFAYSFDNEGTLQYHYVGLYNFDEDSTYLEYRIHKHSDHFKDLTHCTSGISHDNSQIYVAYGISETSTLVQYYGYFKRIDVEEKRNSAGHISGISHL